MSDTASTLMRLDLIVGEVSRAMADPDLDFTTARTLRRFVVALEQRATEVALMSRAVTFLTDYPSRNLRHHSRASGMSGA